MSKDKHTPGALVDRICHKEQLGVWSGELAAALSLGDFLKEDWTFDDSVDLEKEVEAQLKDIIGSALTHPEVNVTELFQEMLAALQAMQVEADAADVIGYGWDKARSLTRAAIAAATGEQP